MEEEDKKSSSFTKAILGFLIMISMVAGFAYCGFTIYKGVIRQAIVEALEQTKIRVIIDK